MREQFRVGCFFQKSVWEEKAAATTASLSDSPAKGSPDEVTRLEEDAVAGKEKRELAAKGSREEKNSEARDEGNDASIEARNTRGSELHGTRIIDPTTVPLCIRSRAPGVDKKAAASHSTHYSAISIIFRNSE